VPVQTADRDFFAKRGRKGPERAESSRRRVERVLWESGEAYSCYVAVSCFVALRALTLCTVHMWQETVWRLEIPNSVFALLCVSSSIRVQYSRVQSARGNLNQKPETRDV